MTQLQEVDWDRCVVCHLHSAVATRSLHKMMCSVR